MPLIRKRLSWLDLAGWLATQLAVLVSAPVALHAMSTLAVSAGEAARDCPGYRRHGSSARCIVSTAPTIMASTIKAMKRAARCAAPSIRSDAALLVLVTPGVVPQSRLVPEVPEQIRSRCRGSERQSFAPPNCPSFHLRAPDPSPHFFS